MNKETVAVISVVATLFVCYIFGGKYLENRENEEYSLGYEAGMEEGQNSAYDLGKKDGETQGYEDGYSDGSAYAENWVEEEYSKGYIDGYNDSELGYYPTNDPEIVYVTKSGTEYHVLGCKFLKNSCISISLSHALDEGYGPCVFCNPPQ